MDFPSPPPSRCSLVLGLLVSPLRCGSACLLATTGALLGALWEATFPRYQKTDVSVLEWRRRLFGLVFLVQLATACLRLGTGDTSNSLLGLAQVLLGNTARCSLQWSRLMPFALLACMAAGLDLGRLAVAWAREGAGLVALPLSTHCRKDLFVGCLFLGPLLQVIGARVAWSCCLEPSLLTRREGDACAAGSAQAPGYGALESSRRCSIWHVAAVLSRG
mmetsp:Transcript_95421/g.297101  ORF Transcript_95421/g.297101 Transcript_95421/m.297101 type:complete len:219 (+) Transcript_95421:72-728(+)